MLPREIAEHFKTAVSPLLRQVRGMPDIGITSDEDRRQGTLTAIEYCARLLEIAHGKPQLMHQHRCYNARVVHAQRLRLQSVTYAERGKIRNAAQQIEWIIG